MEFLVTNAVKDKWCNENIGEFFVNKETGNKAKFISRSDEPSVTLGLPNGEIVGFGIGSLNDRGWEIYEEKKTLSDKIDTICNCCHNDLESKDVKKSLKEFIVYVTDGIGLSLANDREAKAKEIFGEKLI